MAGSYTGWLGVSPRRDGTCAATDERMAKTSAKANPMNKDGGDRNRGSEPGQEQKNERYDRQNMGPGRGTEVHAVNQGRTLRKEGAPHTRVERGDARRTKRR